MAAKTSAATERALARIKAGETPYAAAKAEGIALSTIYRAVRKPEPYKGKGVRYLGERVLRKAGKTGKK